MHFPINLLLFPSTQRTESRARLASGYQRDTNENGAPARCHESNSFGGSAELLIAETVEASKARILVSKERANEFFVTLGLGSRAATLVRDGPASVDMDPKIEIQNRVKMKIIIYSHSNFQASSRVFARQICMSGILQYAVYTVAELEEISSALLCHRRVEAVSPPETVHLLV